MRKIGKQLFDFDKYILLRIPDYYSAVLVMCWPGAAEHGALRRPVQPHEAPGAVQDLVLQDHGGVLPAG